MPPRVKDGPERVIGLFSIPASVCFLYASSAIVRWASFVFLWYGVYIVFRNPVQKKDKKENGKRPCS